MINISSIDGRSSLNPRSSIALLASEITRRISSEVFRRSLAPRFPSRSGGRASTDATSEPRAACSEAKSPRKRISILLSLKRRRSSATLPLSMSWLLLIRVMESHSSSTLDMLWVENITVAPSSRSLRISRLSTLALMGSKPENGSSNISSSGL